MAMHRFVIASFAGNWVPVHPLDWQLFSGFGELTPYFAPGKLTTHVDQYLRPQDCWLQ